MTSKRIDRAVGSHEDPATRSRAAAARKVAGRIATHLPATIAAMSAGARDATSALQTLTDPTLRVLGASSVGLGVGFYLAGAPRLVIVAGLVPAAVLGSAIVMRPVEPPRADQWSGRGPAADGS
jgi:uncharacterized protein YjeT (DUF2065 family)